MVAKANSFPIGWPLVPERPRRTETVRERTGPPEEYDEEPRGGGGCIVYTAGSLYEAHLVLDLLGQTGIEARLFNEHLVGAMGELPFAATLPQVWLSNIEDAGAARGVIEAYEARRRQPVDGTRICPACGEEGPENFELCWSCHEPYEAE